MVWVQQLSVRAWLIGGTHMQEVVVELAGAEDHLADAVSVLHDLGVLLPARRQEEGAGQKEGRQQG